MANTATTGNVTLTGGYTGYSTGYAGIAGAPGTVYTLSVGGAGGAAGTATASSAVWNGVTYGATYSTPGSVKYGDKDITIDGASLRDFMHTVQDHLGIMRPNPELEKEFDELKACADRYRELEKKFLEQKKVLDILKKPD